MFGAETLQRHLHVGIGIVAIQLTGTHILLFGLCHQLLVILLVNARLVGAVVGDEALQARLHRVGQCLGYKCVLCLCGYGDDGCLLVNIDGDIFSDDIGDVVLSLRQDVWVVFLLAYHLFGLFGK